MTYGSLFSGVGGFDSGLDQSGMTCRWQCEINQDAQKILAKHWPNVVRVGDIRRFDATSSQWQVDVLAASFPCQDVSLCGYRAGLEGDQSRLFWEYTRVLEEVGPRWTVLENVEGLATRNSGRDMWTVLDALGKRGYVWAWRIFDTRYFGLPQIRRRVFIVGHLGSWTGPAGVIFDAESLSEGPDDGQEQRRDSSRQCTRSTGFTFQTRIARCKRGLPSELLPTLTNYEGCGIHSDAKPHVVTKSGIRRLTAEETELAMGFPVGWTSGLPYRKRLALLGNAVSPAISRWIGSRLLVEHESLKIAV